MTLPLSKHSICTKEYIKGLRRFLLRQSRAEIDDVAQCVFKPPFTQVIKSCWRGRQGCSVSLGSFPALYETGSTNTKVHMCSHSKICSNSLLSFALYMCLLICLPFSLSRSLPIIQPPPPVSLPLLLQLSLHLIISSPLRYSSLSLPQEEPQSYLGYVGFGELKSHFTYSLPASPENSASNLKQFHHLPGFVCWNAAHQATFFSFLSPLNANPLPELLSIFLTSPLLFLLPFLPLLLLCSSTD